MLTHLKRVCHLLFSFRGEWGEVKSGGCMGESGGVWGAQKLALNGPYLTIWLSDNQLDKKAGSALV